MDKGRGQLFDLLDGHVHLRPLLNVPEMKVLQLWLFVYDKKTYSHGQGQGLGHYIGQRVNTKTSAVNSHWHRSRVFPVPRGKENIQV